MKGKGFCGVAEGNDGVGSLELEQKGFCGWRRGMMGGGGEGVKGGGME